MPTPERIEPHLLIGRGVDRCPDRTAARIPTTRLIDQIDRKATAQKDSLEPFPAIGCGFPGLRELPVAVQKHERKLPPIRWNLIEDVCVIAVQCLPAIGRWLLGD